MWPKLQTEIPIILEPRLEKFKFFAEQSQDFHKPHFSVLMLLDSRFGRNQLRNEKYNALLEATLVNFWEARPLTFGGLAISGWGANKLLPPSTRT